MTSLIKLKTQTKKAHTTLMRPHYICPNYSVVIVRSASMSENGDVSTSTLQNNTCEIDELESEIAESESRFSTGTDIGRLQDFGITKRFFDTCLTCEEIGKPSPSFTGILKNLAVHEK